MIKNKNGEEYRISKPNPLMKYQDLWSIYTLHNFFWDETIEENKKQTSKKIEEVLKEEEEVEKVLKEEVEEVLEEKVKEVLEEERRDKKG
jgi:vacuolar-type H+-ATPase catalytic subunit A/Vma1